jgi:xanthine dehydrogenase accessory factor
MLSVLLDSPSRDVVNKIAERYAQKKYGELEISPRGLALHTDTLNDDDVWFSSRREDDWLYKENVGVLDTIYIVGSGHVGLALSRVMATLDFRVVAIDDRGTVETFAKNAYADEKILSTYDKLGDFVRDGNRSYVAVVTTAYKSDEAALKSLFAKQPHYIGVMGSAAKLKQIFDDLKNEGISDEQLNRIHAPIGVQIGSHTAEEIAVSIAAEIIKVRNGSA